LAANRATGAAVLECNERGRDFPTGLALVAQLDRAALF
jgi:hypothetical protein